MILWCNILVVLLVKCYTNAEILIDSDGGYKNIIVGISPNLKKSDVESLLYQLKALFRNTSETLYTASQKNVFFKEIIFTIPKEYETWFSSTNILIDGTTVKPYEKPDFYVTSDDIFHAPYTVQHSGCGKPGRRINIPNDFLTSSTNRKGLSLVRQWTHYRYGVFSESGFPSDDIYPACYKIPGSDNIMITDCTNEKPVYEFQNHGRSSNICSPSPVSGKNSHVISSVMTDIDFPEMSFFCDNDSRPHNRHAPTKQNALCREKSTWEVISESVDFKIKSKDTSNVRPTFRHVLESSPNFVVAVDTSSEMDLNERMTMTLNAFSYFIFYDLPHNSTVRLIDMKSKDNTITEKTILKEGDARWLVEMFPETGGEGDICVHCTIQKLLENLKLDINDIIIITATDITSSWIDNITTMLKSNKVALHVIYFEKQLRHQAFLERIAKSSGGTFFYISESFPPGSSVSPLTLLYEAFRAIYESFSWLNRKRVLVDQMTFSNNCLPKCVLSFPSDRSIETLQIVVTGTEFGRNSPLLRKTMALSNGVHQFVPGNETFTYKSEIPAYVITVHYPQIGIWNLTFERRPGFNKDVIAIVRAESRDYGDIITMQSWTSDAGNKNVDKLDRPPITIYSEITKYNNPVIDVQVTALVHQASYNAEWSLDLKDSGDGDPDITKNDGIYSRYLTDIADSGYYSVTVVAEKTSLKYHEPPNEKNKESKCCGSFIPEHLSYDSGHFKRVTTYYSFFVSEEKAGKTYPPRRIVDLRIDRIEILSNNKKCYVLLWTAPGENYDKGRALSYNIKVFSSRKAALDDFHTGHVQIIKMLNIQGPLLEPQEAGTIQNAYVEFTNLTSGTYFIAMTTTSHSGKVSDVSNAVELTYAELNPSFTDDGFSKDEFYTSPFDSTSEKTPNEEPKSSSNFALIIGLTCGILLLLLITGCILFVYLERRRKAKNKTSASNNQNTKKTESSDALCHVNGGGNISIISPVTSWGANSLVSHYETLQQHKMPEVSGMLTNPETDSLSLTSSKCSFDNKTDQNSSPYDPIYYHQIRSQDELNYPYNPSYTPFDPMYTSSLRRLDNSNVMDNPYCSDNLSYCSYSLNRNQLSRLKTDV